ncbi:MAG: DEAD/DEAH box helicase [Opitutales bacterium]|nr:DEAD/DEAH box helicase [Opitutales bacterium]
MLTIPSFSTLGLAEPLLRALADKNYTEPSPIQAQAIPHLLDGRDLLGCAQTGTGKTAAFALPILHRLSKHPPVRMARRPGVLVLTPTRELAAQIGESFAHYGKYLPFRHTVIFGGVGQNPQVRALREGVDIVVATPGRLLDLAEQGCIDLSGVGVFVLDEADRMLDMGFAPDVKRVMARLPERRQSLLFSATMPGPILEIANRLLHDPVKVEVVPASSTADKVVQHVCHVDRGDKPDLLAHTIHSHAGGLVLVFSRTKHGANKLVKKLGQNRIAASAIHGNKSQTARERALEDFRSGKVRVLVATDIAARGIDVKGVSLVINYDLPNEPESYVHRIGRTARAGADGLAIAFCDPDERVYLRDIERLIRIDVPVMSDHPYALATPNLHQLGGGGSKGRGGSAGRGGPRRSGSAPVRDMGGMASNNAPNRPRNRFRSSRRAGGR